MATRLPKKPEVASLTPQAFELSLDELRVVRAALPVFAVAGATDEAPSVRRAKLKVFLAYTYRTASAAWPLIGKLAKGDVVEIHEVEPDGTANVIVPLVQGRHVLVPLHASEFELTDQPTNGWEFELAEESGDRSQESEAGPVRPSLITNH